MLNYFSFSMALFTSLVLAFAALLPSPASSTSLLDNNPARRQATMDHLAATVTANDGEFYVDFLIGTPPKSYSLVLDTDSDLIWTANYSKTSTSYSKLPCYSNLCTKAKATCDRSTFACQYKYISTNLTTFQVDLATETFTFKDNIKVRNLAFAYTAVENTTGGLGLGHGPLSLVSQMKASRFSVCLSDYDHPDKKGFLYVGSLAKSYPQMITTKLVKSSPKKPSAYYITVQGISVNNVLLPIDISSFAIDTKTGTGGVIIDTGCTMTYLNENIFNPLRNELQKQIRRTPATIRRDLNLPLCYETPIVYPNITIHFSGSSKLTLSVGNTFRQYTNKTTKRNTTCLAMAVAPSSDRGMSSLGNIQLQNTVMFMDLAKQTVGFQPNTECDTVK